MCIHRGEHGQVDNQRQMMRIIYKGLWQYFYADRAVSPKSTATIHRGNLPNCSQDSAFISKEDDTEKLLQLVDEVTKEVREKQYLWLKLEGCSEEEIKRSLDVSDRTINGMRATIVKRIKNETPEVYVAE